MQDILSKKIPLIEIFVSISGEGSTTGEIVTFVRTAGCNLRCSYCDTTYSYEPVEEKTIGEIIDIVKKNNTPKVVLTGGEPLFGAGKRDLAKEMAKAGINVYIETNGSVPLFDEEEIKDIRHNIHYVMDYKSTSSNMRDKNLILDNVKVMNETDEIKFVMGKEEEFYEALEVIDSIKEELSNKLVNLIFGCVFQELQPDRLVEVLKENNDYFINNNLRYKLNLQIHKFVWDPNERGV